MEFRLSIILVLSFSLLFYSCKKGHELDCVTSTGKIINENRNIVSFDSIEVYDNVNVKLIQDSLFSVEVKAGKNIIHNIITDVKNNTLLIKNENTCNWVRSYKKEMSVIVRLPDLKSIRIKGFGNVESINKLLFSSIFIHQTGNGNTILNIESEYLSCDMYNYGDVYLTGNALKSNIKVNGFGFYYGFNFCSKNSEVVNTGEGTLETCVNEKINAHLTSVGNIYIKGDYLIKEEKDEGDGTVFWL